MTLARALRFLRNLNPYYRIAALRAEISIPESTVRFRDDTIRELRRRNERLLRGFRAVKGGPR